MPPLQPSVPMPLAPIGTAVIRNGSGVTISKSTGWRVISSTTSDMAASSARPEQGSAIQPACVRNTCPGIPHGGSLHLAFGKTPSAYMKPVDAGTAKYRDIYWRFDLRLHPDWTGGGADKLTRATILSSDRFAQAAIGHLWSGALPGSDPERLYLDPASGTDESGALRTTTYNDFPRLRWLGAAGGHTPLFSQTNIGTWFCIEVHMKLNNGDAGDGVLEYWIDDRLEAQRSGINWIGSYRDYGINAVYLEQYWTSVPFAHVQQRYFDNFVVSTARIGCAL